MPSPPATEPAGSPSTPPRRDRRQVEQRLAERRLAERRLALRTIAALLPVVLVFGVLLVRRELDRGRASDAATFNLTVADQEAIEADVDHKVIDFDGTLLRSGAAWSSRSARGKVLVVNIWASWCAPCRAEQPALTTVARRDRDRGVTFIGINVRDDRAAAQAYTDEFAVPYESLYDPSAAAAAKLAAFALPTTFVLDRDGVVAYRLTGRTTAPLLSARIDGLLARGGRWQA